MPFVTQYNLPVPNLKLVVDSFPKETKFFKWDRFFLTWGKFYRLELGYVMRTIEFPLTATPKREQEQIQIPR